ncbi:hypothetical protein IscW_ISCW007525 [Ixodes scapularis]|uniref:Uncharacterized protein n=1 Tax=Ixodes scapularis TaxID=6945 RepID=B7PWL8_IXOSC|nr:hypothetical protein IscW_ISCW007525 [Ixodes scapularis]|eukprot:XP_002410004.1 hypothetical protein IscW_ISCW007525 [Ixodes scapularis]
MTGGSQLAETTGLRGGLQWTRGLPARGVLRVRHAALQHPHLHEAGPDRRHVPPEQRTREPQLVVPPWNRVCQSQHIHPVLPLRRRHDLLGCPVPTHQGRFRQRSGLPAVNDALLVRRLVDCRKVSRFLAHAKNSPRRLRVWLSVNHAFARMQMHRVDPSFDCQLSPSL